MDNDDKIDIDLSDNIDEGDNSEFIESDDDDQIPQNDIFDKPPVITAPVRKKKTLSEEHKKKLMAGRLKGLEARRERARQNKELKELEKKKKQLYRENLQKEVQQMEVINPHEELNPSNNGFTDDFKDKYKLSHDDILRMQEEAISNYEIKRKERKAIKKEKEHNDRMKAVVQKAQSNVENAWMMYVPQ